MTLIIAIDGEASSGKGSLTKKLATFYGVDYLDTGAIYRKLAYLVLEKGWDCSNETQVLEVAISAEFKNFVETHSDLNLHTKELSEGSSKLAVFPKVRIELNNCQRAFPIGKKVSIIDGRDIGTVIFPNAQIKLFIKAKVEVRAERRYKQLINSQKDVSYKEVLEDLIARDIRDSQRSCSPTIPADDAIILDTSDLDAEGVFYLVKSLCENKINEYLN
jgi:CMP/dCMP kinase